MNAIKANISYSHILDEGNWSNHSKIFPFGIKLFGLEGN